MIDLNYETAHKIDVKAGQVKDAVKQMLRELATTAGLDDLLGSASKAKYGMLLETCDGHMRVVEITVNVAEKPFVEKTPGVRRVQVPPGQRSFGIDGDMGDGA